MPQTSDFEEPIAELERALTELESSGDQNGTEHQRRVADLRRRCQDRKADIYGSLTGWQTVQVARHPERPKLENLIPLVFEDFFELHGDRYVGDDRVLTGTTTRPPAPSRPRFSEASGCSRDSR